LYLILIPLPANGIHSLFDVPTDITYKATLFSEQVLRGLVGDITFHVARKIVKIFLIHLDNAGLHNSGMSQECIETSGPQPAQHPVYRRNLVSI
jgi:hypothetical protein